MVIWVHAAAGGADKNGNGGSDGEDGDIGGSDDDD